MIFTDCLSKFIRKPDSHIIFKNTAPAHFRLYSGLCQQTNPKLSRVTKRTIRSPLREWNPFRILLDKTWRLSSRKCQKQPKSPPFLRTAMHCLIFGARQCLSHPIASLSFVTIVIFICLWGTAPSGKSHISRFNISPPVCRHTSYPNNVE